MLLCRRAVHLAFWAGRRAGAFSARVHRRLGNAHFSKVRQPGIAENQYPAQTNPAPPKNHHRLFRVLYGLDQIAMPDLEIPRQHITARVEYTSHNNFCPAGGRSTTQPSGDAAVAHKDPPAINHPRQMSASALSTDAGTPPRMRGGELFRLTLAVGAGALQLLAAPPRKVKVGGRAPSQRSCAPQSCPGISFSRPRAARACAFRTETTPPPSVYCASWGVGI